MICGRDPTPPESLPLVLEPIPLAPSASGLLGVYELADELDVSERTVWYYLAALGIEGDWDDGRRRRVFSHSQVEAIRDYRERVGVSDEVFRDGEAVKKRADVVARERDYTKRWVTELVARGTVSGSITSSLVYADDVAFTEYLGNRWRKAPRPSPGGAGGPPYPY